MDLATGSSVSISPDGKRLAFTTSNSSQNETLMGVSDTDGGNQRFLMRAGNDTRYLSMFKTSPVAWSPDGSEIALAVNDKTGANPGSTILLVDPETGMERYLTDRRWKEIDYLVWLDSDRLAFIGTDETGHPSQIWLFSRQTGEAKSLTNDLQKYSWLAATNGKLFRFSSARRRVPESPTLTRRISRFELVRFLPLPNISKISTGTRTGKLSTFRGAAARANYGE
ncbi:MAG: DPP IV N-terminal domain-containing protein [Acidobacteria bacterium]|nr:DPP IV N-terminal domain-containing protein [Acidobacteriota bacterium]